MFSPSRFKFYWRFGDETLELGLLPTSRHSGVGLCDTFAVQDWAPKWIAWERLIPKVGILTTTGPLGTVEPDSLRFWALWCISLKSVIAHWELLFNSSHALVSVFPFQSLRHRRRQGIAARVSRS
uniref:Uncharacterized protein n=1 Tax=Ananas comosus var. bracteatus TaxID=296719 RepID=A0A6V7PSV0_ANACO|nr:unnamed protein product [Ananas comosus var. bracteatus]